MNNPALSFLLTCLRIPWYVYKKNDQVNHGETICDFTIKYGRADDNKIAVTLSRYGSKCSELYKSDSSNAEILNMKFEVTLKLQQRISNIHLKQNTDLNI